MWAYNIIVLYIACFSHFILHNTDASNRFNTQESYCNAYNIAIVHYKIATILYTLSITIHFSREEHYKRFSIWMTVMKTLFFGLQYTSVYH